MSAADTVSTAASEATSSEGSIVLAWAPEPWQVLVVLLLAAGAAWAVWRWYGPRVPGVAGRIAAGCRCAAVAALVFLAAGPSWETQREHQGIGDLLMVVDRSGSMTRQDYQGERRRIAAVEDVARIWQQQRSQDEARLQWLGIGGGIASLPEPRAADSAALTRAEGATSPLGEELVDLLVRRAPDAIGLISDGRVTDGRELAAAARAFRARGIPVHTLAVGSERVDPDLRIDDVLVPTTIARGERQPLLIRLAGVALAEGQQSTVIRISHDGQLLETATLSLQPQPGEQAVQQFSGEARLGVVLDEEGPGVLTISAEAGDGLADRQQIDIEVHERRLQVLMLVHRPRYEMRYLREALRRDATATVHSYLADGGWRRWGGPSFGPDRLDLSPGALEDYDAVVIGDLGADLLPEGADEALSAAVRRKGAGIVWVPGETGAIASFKGTALGRLIPARLPGAAAISRGYLDQDPRAAQRTEAAERLGLLDPGTVLWQELPPLLGAAPVQEPMPGALVLMASETGQPLVLTRDYGTGRAVLVASDDSWRWRRNVGDFYLHRMHSQLLRWVSGGRLQGRKPWRVVATPARATLGAPITVAVVKEGPRPEDERLPDRITVALEHSDGTRRLVPLRQRSGEDLYEGSVRLEQTGSWSADVSAGLVPEDVRPLTITVHEPVAETRDPRVDRAALRDLAQATGGMATDSPTAFVTDLPDLRRRTVTTSRTTQWDRWWVLMLVTALLAVDWALRRHARLP